MPRALPHAGGGARWGARPPPPPPPLLRHHLEARTRSRLLITGHTRTCRGHLPPSPPLTQHGPSAPLTPTLRTDPPVPVTRGTVTWHCDLPDEGHHINTVRRALGTRRCYSCVLFKQLHWVLIIISFLYLGPLERRAEGCRLIKTLFFFF